MQQGNEDTSVLLVICDISGYTRFMIANHEAQRHGSVIITELIQAVLRQTHSPFRVAKLEGDAIFLYAELPPQPGEHAAWGAARREEIHRLFWAFEAKLTELVESNICTCGGCVNAGRLRLKIVAHAGSVVRHRIGKFEEVSGVDVIVAHRLLKNSVAQDQYLLMTPPAYALLWQTSDSAAVTGAEHYDDLGQVVTIVVTPPSRPADDALNADKRAYATWPYKVKNLLRRIAQSRLLWLRGSRHLRLMPANLPDGPTPPEPQHKRP